MASMLQQIIQGMGTDFSSPGAGTPSSMASSQQPAPQSSLSGTIMGAGGAPLTGNATPSGNTGLTSNIAPTNTGITSSSPLSSLATPGTATNAGMYSLQPYTGTSGLADPFNYSSEGGPDNGYDESTSPGTQQYGSDWTTLLNSMGQLPTASPLNPIAAPNDNSYDTNMARLSVLSNPNYGSQGSTPIPLQNQINGINDRANPLGNVQGGDQTGLAAKTRDDYSSFGDFGGAASNALPAISRTFGLDPNSAQAKNLSNAYVTDVLQNNKYDDYHNYLTDTKHDDFGLILGQLARTGAYALAGGAAGLASGAAAGGAAAAASTAEGAGEGAASVGSTLGGLSDSFGSLIPSLDSLSSSEGLFNTVAGHALSLAPTGGLSVPSASSVFGGPLTLTSAILGASGSPSFAGGSGNTFNTDFNPYAKNAANTWTQ